MKILLKQSYLAERLIEEKQKEMTSSSYQTKIFGDSGMTAQERQAKLEYELKLHELIDLKKKVAGAKEKTEALLRKKDILRKDDIDSLRRFYFQTGEVPTTFIWHIDFAEVFTEKNGFDIVIGNPPYVNMVEMDARPDIWNRDRIRSLFVTARGGFDLFVPFYECAIRINRPNGYFTLITPNKLLSAEYAQEARKYLIEKATLLNLADVAHCKPFEAAVYPITTLFLNGKETGNVTIYRGVRKGSDIQITMIAEIPSRMIEELPNNIWTPLVQLGYTILTKVMAISKPLSTYCTVKGAATVSEAYEIKEILGNKENAKKGKFLVSGNLDRYLNSWGRYRTQYIKDQYQYPYLPENKSVLSRTRIKQMNSSKIIISGMAKRPKAFLDINGEYAAAKSTVIIYDSQVDLAFLCGLLNSSLLCLFII